MDDKLISVIVPTFNAERYLDRCIESLVIQTYPHLEIILVDDGSSDKTGAICDNWANKDSRIIVIHKKNGGVSDARNAGIRRASGKWLGFVDGDDFVLPTMYEHLYQYRVGQGITVCGIQIKESETLHFYPAIDKELSPREALDLYLENELQSLCNGSFTYWGAYLCNKLFDRNLFAQVLFPIDKKYEDMYIILDLIHRAASIRFITNCEYIYERHPGSITREVANIVHDSLQARLHQKEQLLKYWQITDARIEKLLVCEYYYILSRYASLSQAKRKKHEETAVNIRKKLQKQGYDFFPLKKKIYLFLCIHCPDLFYLLKKIQLWVKDR